jgi:hypothetical protein
MGHRETFGRCVRVVLAALIVQQIGAASARAQAWVPAKGEGAVAISFSDMFVKNHRLPEVEIDRGHITGRSLLLDLTYGLTDKIAIDVAIPYVVSKYSGARPHPSNLDNGAYHGTFQDFRLAFRYNVLSGPLTITPFAGAIIPSHHYQYFAHSAPGRQLREITVGTYAGARLDPVVPGGFVQARYAYGFTQEVLHIAHNRSVFDLEVGHFVRDSLRVFALGNVQRTHGGVDLSLDSPQTLGPILFSRHDQITRDNHINLGIGAAYSLNESMDIFGSIGTNVSGRNGHAIRRGITIGMAWSFGGNRSDLIVRAPEPPSDRRAQQKSLVRCICQKNGA